MIAGSHAAISVAGGQPSPCCGHEHGELPKLPPAAMCTGYCMPLCDLGLVLAGPWHQFTCLGPVVNGWPVSGVGRDIVGTVEAVQLVAPTLLHQRGRRGDASLGVATGEPRRSEAIPVH
ncbi:hypothetical protein J1614_005287 [Plenodomus biglobosus]|nr:hypothetical protein J1614_005287 [Plenodomus biglobosus]